MQGGEGPWLLSKYGAYRVAELCLAPSTCPPGPSIQGAEDPHEVLAVDY